MRFAIFCSWIKLVLPVGQVLTFMVLTVFKSECFIDKSVFVNTKPSGTHLHCSLWIQGLMHMFCNRNSGQSFYHPNPDPLCCGCKVLKTSFLLNLCEKTSVFVLFAS